MRPERDPERVRRLTERLLADLNAGAWTAVHLAAPEPVDWLELGHFVLSSAPDVHEADPHITTYLQSREDEVLDLDQLKADRLSAVRASDGLTMARWRVLDCFVYDVELDGFAYVLSGGRWFRIDGDYMRDLYAEVGELPVLEGLPEADPGTDEDCANRKLASTLGALCLDKKLVFDGGPDKLEICDVLTRAGCFIHVKQRGSSSTLSHLFGQGLNSAERLLADPRFRASARTVIEREDGSFADVVPAKRPAGAFGVAFVVITRSNRTAHAADLRSSPS